MDMPLVISTIIPTYRRPQLLQRAILSVLNQSYPHVRACVYDNASGDETEEVVMELMQRDPRIRYHRHPHNIGSYPNFNYGLRALDTPLFSLLSDDDVLAPDFYAHAVKAFQNHPDAMFVSMATMVVDSDMRVISKPIPVDKVRYYAHGQAVRGILQGNIPSTWTGIVYRREVAKGVGYIDTTVGPHADGGFVYHAAARYPGVVLPGIAAVLMAHEKSVSGSSVPVSGEWVKWWEAMMRSVYEDQEVPPIVRKLVRNIPGPDYRRIGLKQIGRALADGRHEYAGRVARGIGECGYPVSGRLLQVLSRLCALEPANAFIRLIRVTRKKWHASRRDALQKEYGHLVEFMRRYAIEGVNTLDAKGRR